MHVYPIFSYLISFSLAIYIFHSVILSICFLTSKHTHRRILPFTRLISQRSQSQANPCSLILKNCSDSRPRDIYSAFPPLISKKDLKFRLADRVLPESTSFRLRLRRNEFSRLGAFFTHDYRVYTI